MTQRVPPGPPHHDPACSQQIQAEEAAPGAWPRGPACPEDQLVLSSFIRRDFCVDTSRPSPHPPLMLMEVLWLGQGVLPERGLGMPTCKHDLSLCKRRDFKINPAYGACSSSPPVWLREEPHAPGQVGGAVRSLPSPDRRASLCKGHGTISCLPSVPHARLDPARPRPSHTQPRRRGCLHLCSPGCAAGTVVMPASHVGKLRTEVAATLTSHAAGRRWCWRLTPGPLLVSAMLLTPSRVLSKRLAATCSVPGLCSGHRSKSCTVLPRRVTGPRRGDAVSAGGVGAGRRRADLHRTPEAPEPA